MECPELSIAVEKLIGVPKVTLRGHMDGWHDQAMSGVLSGFRDQGTTSLVLDIAGLNFASSGATSMVNVLRKLGPQMCVHVVTSGTSARVLEKAELGPAVRLYQSTDELAECIAPDSEEDLTSRWVAPQSGDNELPIAA